MSDRETPAESRHWAWRQWLVEAHHSSSQDFDKAVMTVASGALGLSITFVHDFAPKAIHRGLLAAAWALLATSLLAILISHLASQDATLHEIKKLDNENTGWSIAWWATSLLNYGAALSLVAGVLCLVVFGLYNVGHG